MAFSLRDFAEEAFAQVNPLDRGKTAATVRATRKSAPPARTLKVNSVGRASNSKQLQDQFKRKEIDRNRFLRDFASITNSPTNAGFFDKYSPSNVKQAAVEAPKQIVGDVNRAVQNPNQFKAQFGRGVSNPVLRTGAQIVEDFVNAPLTGTNAVQRIRRGDIYGGGGELLKAGLEGPLGVLPVGRAVQGGVKATGLVNKVRQGAVTGAKTGAVFGSAYGGAEAASRNVQPTQLVQSAAVGAGVGALAGGVLGGGAPLVKPAFRAGSKAAGPQVDPKLSQKRNQLAVSYSNAKSKRDPALLDAIGRQIDEIDQMIDMQRQGGYAKVPKKPSKQSGGKEFEGMLEQSGIKLRGRSSRKPSPTRSQRASKQTPETAPPSPSAQKSLQQSASPSPRVAQGTLEPSAGSNLTAGLPEAQLQIPQKGVSSSNRKLQQKTPVVNEAKRAIATEGRATYGLRESFDESENVPKELKEVLGAFGNDRTVKNNKELWANAQRRVGEDPAGAYKHFVENSNDEAVATGYALINRYMRNGMSKEAGEVAITMAERALESGRTTQAYALMKKLTPEGSVAYVEKKIERFKAQNPKKANKLNWDDAKRKQLYELADSINKMPEGTKRNLEIGKMQDLVDNIFPSSLLDKAVTVWKAGLLTSLRTHERNILSNTINTAAEQASTVPGSFADMLMGLRTGKRTLTATPRGMGKGVKTGAEYAKAQVKTGVDVTNSKLKYNIHHITWGNNKVEKALKGFTESVFRTLGAEDKLFKEAARKNSLYNQAIASSKTNKLKGEDKKKFIQGFVDNPSAKAMDIADQDAGRATFTHDNVLADAISSGKRALRNKSTGAGAAADIVMPFTQVPSGVASQLYAYSPVKLGKSMYDIGKVLITGDSELQRKAARGFGRSVIGTSILGAGAYLYSKGLMTGHPKDDAEKAQWEAVGIKPNAVKVGDRWLQVNSIGPQTILALAGSQYARDKDEGEDAGVNLGANIAKNFKDQTFLKGMSSALDAVGDPERYAKAYLENQAASVIPNIVKDTARAVDPNERETRNIGDKFKSSVPRLSQSLPKRYDSHGQEIKNSGVGELLDLFNSSKQRSLPEAEYTQLLRAITGEKSHIPTKVPKTVTIDGEKLKLNAQQYSDYQKMVGEQTKKVLTQLSNDFAFNQLPEEDRVRKIDNILRDINKAAKIQLFGDEGFGTDTYDPTSLSKGVRDILAGKAPSYQPPKTTGKASKTRKVSKGSRKSRRRSSRKTAKGKYDYKLFSFGPPPTSMSKSLRQMVADARVKA